MNRSKTPYLLPAVMLFACCAARGATPDEKIELDRAPAAIRAAVTKAVGDGKLEELAKTTIDGKTVYEAEYHIKNREHTIRLTETGQTIDEAVEIPLSSVPATVLDAARALYPDARADEAELVTAPGRAKFYRVSVDFSPTRERELDYEAHGKLIADREDD